MPPPRIAEVASLRILDSRMSVRHCGDFKAASTSIAGGGRGEPVGLTMRGSVLLSSSLVGVVDACTSEGRKQLMILQEGSETQGIRHSFLVRRTMMVG